MWCSVQKDNHWAVPSSPQILVWLDWLTHNALWHPILHHQNLILRKTKTIFLIIHLGDFIEHVHSNLPLMATSLQWPLFLSQWASWRLSWTHYHLNSSCHTVNNIFTSMRTKCTFYRIGQYNKRFYFVSPNLQNLQHGVPETGILWRSKRVD